MTAASVCSSMSARLISSSMPVGVASCRVGAASTQTPESTLESIIVP